VNQRHTKASRFRKVKDGKVEMLLVFTLLKFRYSTSDSSGPGSNSSGFEESCRVCTYRHPVLIQLPAIIEVVRYEAIDDVKRGRHSLFWLSQQNPRHPDF